MHNQDNSTLLPLMLGRIRKTLRLPPLHLCQLLSVTKCSSKTAFISTAEKRWVRYNHDLLRQRKSHDDLSIAQTLQQMSLWHTWSAKGLSYVEVRTKCLLPTFLRSENQETLERRPQRHRGLPCPPQKSKLPVKRSQKPYFQTLFEDCFDRFTDLHPVFMLSLWGALAVPVLLPLTSALRW